MTAKPLSLRAAYFAGFAVCAALIAYALYLQYGLDLEPCPLCMFQRVMVVAMGGVFLIAALHSPRRTGAWGYAIAQFLLGGVGIGLALRHLWIQSLPPDQVPACGMGIGYMFETLPLGDVIMRTLAGSGECAKVDLVLGLSIPAWTLMLFVALILWSVVLAVKARR
ncbi:MAG: disulfide bond formation protein B [Betaproteobacteria bacterium]